MAFATATYPGDGIETQWSINFAGGYISEDHVKATLISPEGVESVQEFTFVSPSLLQVTPAVPSGWSIKFYRETPKDTPLVDFVDGAIVNEANLDKATQQAIFAVAEIDDSLVLTMAEAAEATDVSATAIALATAADANAAQAALDAAEALAGVTGAQDAAIAATAAADAANAAATLATDSAVAAVSTADAALLVAQDAEDVANGIAATANAALSAANDAEAAATAAAAGNFASVNITGGSIAGITDLAIADGGTGASTAANARTNLGLGNVDNTSDVSKPISTATQTALNLKVTQTSAIGAAILPAGVIADRPAGVAGYIRYNIELAAFEGYKSAWGPLVPLGTEAINGTVRLATSAEALAGTLDTVATHPLGVAGAIAGNSRSAKAWVNFNGTGVVAIRRAFNVSSITDNGTGSYTANLTAGFADTNYTVVSAIRYQLASGAVFGEAWPLTTTSFRMTSLDIFGGPLDAEVLQAVVFNS